MPSPNLVILHHQVHMASQDKNSKYYLLPDLIKQFSHFSAALPRVKCVYSLGGKIILRCHWNKSSLLYESAHKHTLKCTVKTHALPHLNKYLPSTEIP